MIKLLFLNIGDDLNPMNHDFSYSFWIKTIQPQLGYIVGRYDGDTTWGIQFYNPHEEALVGYFRDKNIEASNPYKTIQSSSQLNDGRFHFVAAVRAKSDSQIRYFIDGIKFIELNDPSLMIDPQNSLVIGSHYPSHSQYFNGVIDDVSIYNRTLSASEIQKLYCKGGYC